jgi:hypothetical protein
MKTKPSASSNGSKISVGDETRTEAPPRSHSHQPLFYPSFRVYNTSLITKHWPELSAVATGTADPTLLPPELFHDIDVEFALMSEAERIALYQRDPEACARRTQDYMQRTKRPTQSKQRDSANIESSSLRSKPLR